MKCPYCLSDVEKGQNYCDVCGRELPQSVNHNPHNYSKNEHYPQHHRSFEVTIPRQYEPISAWGYIGYQILFAIPFIGIILLIVFALSNENINRRNFARSYFCVVLLVILAIVLFGSALNEFIEALFSSI